MWLGKMGVLASCGARKHGFSSESEPSAPGFRLTQTSRSPWVGPTDRLQRPRSYPRTQPHLRLCCRWRILILGDRSSSLVGPAAGDEGLDALAGFVDPAAIGGFDLARAATRIGPRHDMWALYADASWSLCLLSIAPSPSGLEGTSAESHASVEPRSSREVVGNRQSHSFRAKVRMCK